MWRSGLKKKHQTPSSFGKSSYGSSCLGALLHQVLFDLHLVSSAAFSWARPSSPLNCLGDGQMVFRKGRAWLRVFRAALVFFCIFRCSSGSQLPFYNMNLPNNLADGASFRAQLRCLEGLRSQAASELETTGVSEDRTFPRCNASFHFMIFHFRFLSNPLVRTAVQSTYHTYLLVGGKQVQC